MADETLTSGQVKPEKWHDNGDGSFSRTVYDLAGGGGGGDGPTAGASTPVNMTGATVVLVAANANRKSLTVFNNSGVTVYIGPDSGTSASDFGVKMIDQAFYEFPLPCFTGTVYVFGVSGSVLVAEYT